MAAAPPTRRRARWFRSFSASSASFCSPLEGDATWSSASLASDYCRRLIETPELEDKLAPPPADLEIDADAAPLVISRPGRCERLTILNAREVKVPPLLGMRDRHQRARIIHALANHELQATELFAWAVLAFPETPAAFRRGLIQILAEEQRHLGLYRERLRAHGFDFGDFGVTGHFWNQLAAMSTPMAFLCAMGLTFENANLDFAGEYAEAARLVGDDATADALAIVHEEEERHVRFAYRWMTRFKADDESVLAAYERTILFPLCAARARGKTFDRESRVRAGLDSEFIEALEAARAVRPSGVPR